MKEEDEEVIEGKEKKEKSIMVKHFIIDFSRTILMFKIRHDLDDTE